MKCPFLTTRKDVFDKEGKRIGEEIDLQDCIKNQCMVYDGATKLCSLLSSNMKTGVLIDDIKNGLKLVSEELHQRAEALGDNISAVMETLQRTLIERFDIMKKQNEVMVLGFDRLMETINKGFEGIKTMVSESNNATNVLRDTMTETLKASSDMITESLNGLMETVENQGNSIQSATRSVQQAVNEMQVTNAQFATDVKSFGETLFNKLAESDVKNEETSKSVCSRFDALSENLTELTSSSQSGMDAIGKAIEKILSTNQDVLTRLSQLDTMVTSINSMNDVMKTEIAGLKTDGLNALNDVSAQFNELGNIAAALTKVQGKNLQDLINSFAHMGEGIKAEVSELKSDTSALLTSFKAEIGNYLDGVRSEIGNLKNEQIPHLLTVQDTVTKLEGLFKESSDSLGSMNNMIRDLNNNYVESLDKIAGLAEGMRKGVERVGEGMHDSVKDLISEMKNEIGSLEEHYKKTFSDVADLSDKFGDLNSRIKEMTSEVQKEFKTSFDRQEELSEYTKTIVTHIKEYFEKEDARYKEEQKKRKTREGIDHFDRATLYFYRGNYEIAMNEINKALDIEKTAEYLNLKGLLLAELGQFDESKKAYKEALKIEPNFAEIHNNLGLLYLRMKKLDDAVAAFQEALKQNVNYAHAYVNLGNAFIDLERYDDALHAYEEALKIDPTNRDARSAMELYKEGKIGV